MKRKLIRQINGALSKIGVVPLQEWLDRAADLHPAIAQAVEGIYCGREGKVHQELSGELAGIWLTFGWYTPGSTPRVEYAYAS